ncbi:MAG TPA: hypothetical protein VIC62_24565, partial [Nakamurella sp.]
MTKLDVKILVMSPNDVKDERDIVDEVVAGLNDNIGETYRMNLRVLRWERLAGDVGMRPQELINLEFLARDDIRICVGIMWKRLGSPSGGVDPSGREYEAGTIEELQQALAMKRKSGSGWPRILFYRCMRPFYATTVAENEQYGKVIKFFEQFDPDGEHPGLYDSYETD